MKSLQEIYDKYSEASDKGTTHDYITLYESLLAPYRADCTILELGLSVGGSLNMWREYFVNSKIIGIDNNDGFDTASFPDCPIIIGDCTKKETIAKLGDTRLDLIIDDAQHLIEDQVDSFKLLSPRMNKGGLYIMEDIQSIDSTREILLKLHDNCEIVDHREIRNRYDNVLAIYRF